MSSAASPEAADRAREGMLSVFQAQPGFRALPNICYGWIFSSLLLMSTDHSFGAADFAHLTP